jgi:hypothetical protein
MAYLANLRRVTDQQVKDLVSTVPPDPPPAEPRRIEFNSDRPQFAILDYIQTRRRIGRNWVAQCPSCAGAGRDRAKDNLAISVEEPWKYICWAGCSKEQIRSALGAPVPMLSR